MRPLVLASPPNPNLPHQDAIWVGLVQSHYVQGSTEGIFHWLNGYCLEDGPESDDAVEAAAFWNSEHLWAKGQPDDVCGGEDCGGISPVSVFTCEGEACPSTMGTPDVCDASVGPRPTPPPAERTIVSMRN